MKKLLCLISLPFSHHILKANEDINDKYKNLSGDSCKQLLDEFFEIDSNINNFDNEQSNNDIDINI